MKSVFRSLARGSPKLGAAPVSEKRSSLWKVIPVLPLNLPTSPCVRTLLRYIIQQTEDLWVPGDALFFRLLDCTSKGGHHGWWFRVVPSRHRTCWY